ncbi:YraN family protein [Paenibacillus sp. KS-LC4]|uniref:YraN family protein n=1 Tax=Paenibacillus sp. KS-LC4 TaxID=2979727 RepID=UPI0030CA9732
MTDSKAGDSDFSSSKRADKRKWTGKLGEAAAEAYLLTAGYTFVERNWRCRSGELDLIMHGEDKLVIVEVRTRRSGGRFGIAAESVDWRKQKQVRETAQVYLKLTGQLEQSIRFDVIAITLEHDDAIHELKHIIAAF